MNKGLELIEAVWLFGLPAEQVQVVVQRQSIIHSMVQFSDNSILAQLGVPDMRIPIQYALTWPERVPGPAPERDFTKLHELTFDTADEATFRCLAACKKAIGKGGLAPCAANGANEEAVRLFLEGRIPFLKIGELVEGVVDSEAFGGIEGNYYQTQNEYSIYVYYRPMGARYDRLIGVTTVRNEMQVF